MLPHLTPALPDREPARTKPPEQLYGNLRGADGLLSVRASVRSRLLYRGVCRGAAVAFTESVGGGWLPGILRQEPAADTWLAISRPLSEAGWSANWRSLVENGDGTFVLFVDEVADELRAFLEGVAPEFVISAELADQRERSITASPRELARRAEELLDWLTPRVPVERSPQLGRCPATPSRTVHRDRLILAGGNSSGGRTGSGRLGCNRSR